MNSELNRSNPILELKNIFSGYGGNPVIKDINFSVNQGNLFGIIGPNGSGKTTLFKAIARFLKIYKGKIFYKARDVSLIPRKSFFMEVSVVPQAVEIPFSFSVEEIVAMGRYPHVGSWGHLTKRDTDIIEKSMNFTDILPLREKNVDKISGGEKQRVLLAQALVQEPELLLLDEPIAHLDIGHQIKFLNLVKTLNRKRNLTVLIIMHDLNLASEYCDELLLLNDGAVSDIGIPEKVLTYQNVEKVYRTVVVTGKSPVSSKLHIFPVSEDKLKST